ncbi:MAG TPA: CerR family C-terminal domain-containing protein [Pirellulales bacterium]|nr:CerR family C-terminal domain-containing protein [Pirellulales bacterium]
MDSTKARILEAAGNVFAQKGFEAGTVREICQLADVNLAAVNYHFGDKRRLYLAAVSHAYSSRQEELAMAEWPPGTAPEDRLRGWVGAMMERLLGEDRQPWHMQLMMREVASPDVACEALVKEYIRPHFEYLAAILKELVPGEVSEERLALLVFSVVGQGLFYRFSQPIMRLLLGDKAYGTLNPQALAEHVTSMMLAALGVCPDVGSEEFVR